MDDDRANKLKEGLDIVEDANEYEKDGLYKKAAKKYKKAREHFRKNSEGKLHAQCIVAHAANMIKFYLTERDIEIFSENTPNFYIKKIEKGVGSAGLGKHDKYEILISAYRELEKVFRDSNRIDEADDMYFKKTSFYHRRFCQKTKEKKREPIKAASNFLLHHFCGHGGKQWWAVGWIFFTIFFFAGLFNFFRLIPIENPCMIKSMVKSLYFSVVTFTTLGYGDILPICSAGKLIAVTEVIIGLLMLGLLIATIIRKMTR